MLRRRRIAKSVVNTTTQLSTSGSPQQCLSPHDWMRVESDTYWIMLYDPTIGVIEYLILSRLLGGSRAVTHPVKAHLTRQLIGRPSTRSGSGFDRPRGKHPQGPSQTTRSGRPQASIPRQSCHPRPGAGCLAVAVTCQRRGPLASHGHVGCCRRASHLSSNACVGPVGIGSTINRGHAPGCEYRQVDRSKAE